MPSLPPILWAELFFDSTWNTITRDVRQTSAVTVTRGLSSESTQAAEPTSSTLVLDSRDYKYAPRNAASDLFGKIGRNTPFRWGYRAGSPWAESDGTGTSGMTTPHQSAFNVTDLDLRIDIALEDWGAQQGLASRYVASGNNRSWGVYLAGTGQIALVWSPTGTSTTVTQFSTVAVAGYNGQRMTLRITLDVDNGAGGYEVRFYTGRTVDDEEWTLLGDPVVGASTTTLFAATAQIEFGDISDLVLNMLTGKAFSLRLMDSIGGATAHRMTTQDASPGATSFTSGGAVWTVVSPTVLTNQHTRMSGEIPAWPPTRDLSGNDNYVEINPTGITRRMDAGTKAQDSALLRYIKATVPIECWPLTDGSNATRGKSLYGSPDMITHLDAGTALPQWGQGSLAEWIEPTVQMPSGSDGTIKGTLARAASAETGWSVDFLYAGKQDMDVTISDFSDHTDADPAIGWTIQLDVSADQITLRTASVGETTSSTTLQATVSNSGVFDGLLHHVRLTTSVSGSDAPYTLYVDGVSAASGTATGYASEPVRFIRPGWFYASLTQDTPTTGYFTYWGSSAPSALTFYNAAIGFQGERAGTRVERLASEAGYTATVAGPTSQQQFMGVQGKKTLLELLNETAATNFGYLLDARDRNEVIHRGNSTLWNQPPALTLDFSAGLISPPFRPVDDDLLTVNDVSVQREFGAVPARQVLESGELSVLDFPDGVGRYDKSYTYSLYTDDQANSVASMLLSLGTYNGVRYARITLDLANDRVHQMIDDILRIDVGDKIRLSNAPADHGPDDVDVLVQGYTEEAGPTSWKITFNCVPAGPWNLLTLDSSGYARLDTGGCELNGALTSTATSMPVTTTGVRRWVDSATFPSEFPFDLRIGGTSGEVVRATACTGTTASQTFTVTRSINGVVLAHDSGADVRLATPSYIGL